jgi:hypothetical protein
VLPKQPSTKGPAEMFTGDVWFDVIAKGEAPSRMRVTSWSTWPCGRLPAKAPSLHGATT